MVLAGAPSPESDAGFAWSAAFGWQDGTPENRAALANVILTFFDSDAYRIGAAAAVCRTRHAESPDMGWDDAVALLDRAFARLHAAGADRDAGAQAEFAEQLDRELHPEIQPYTWPDRSDPRRGPQRRDYVHARVRWRHQRPATPAGHQILRLLLDDTVIGKLDYQVCDRCRAVYIRKIDVDSRYQGLGLGTRMIGWIGWPSPAYRWRTTVHYPTSGTFWTNLGGDAEFTADLEGFCEHIRHRH